MYVWLELHIQQQKTLFGYLVICLTCWKIRLKPIDVFWNLIAGFLQVYAEPEATRWSSSSKLVVLLVQVAYIT